MRYVDPTGEFAIPFAIPVLPAIGAALTKGVALAGAVIVGLVLGDAASEIIKSESHEESPQTPSPLIDSGVSSAGAMPPPDENEDDREVDFNQSAKDAKKLDTKGAEKFAQDKGYKDVHELKKDVLRSQKDTTVGHYDIYNNAKTGEVFLINKNGKIVIPIE